MVHYKKRRWVKETLKWVVIARRNLDISELRTAVELSVNGSLDDFPKFLEDHCSSLLRITQSSQVQLTHETLRSFLLKKVETLTIEEKKLHEIFAIDETEANGNVTLVCIRTLSDISPESKHFQSYAANFWVDHLSNATSRNIIMTY